jgi:hypothetical protein
MEGAYASCREWLMHAEYVELSDGRYVHHVDTDACGVLPCLRQTQGPFDVRADTVILMNEGDRRPGAVSSEHQRMWLGRVDGEMVLWRTPHWKKLYEHQGSMKGYDPLVYVGSRFEGKYSDCRTLGWYPEDAFAADLAMHNRLDALFGEHVPYQLFLNGLQIAVVMDDRFRVARLVNYPLEVRIGGETVTVGTADELLARYESLLTPKVVGAIERQDYGALFANDQGVMIGDGEVWFGGICGEPSCADITVRIIAINP